MEIERRFLVTNKDKVNELVEKYSDTRKGIVQDYIYSDLFTAIRKRKIEKDNQVKYLYTVKTGRRGKYSVNEYETEISEEEFNILPVDTSRISIIKDRYLIPYVDDLVIELDIFHGKYEGVVFAEIEYVDENQANSVAVPDWFDREIGLKVSNDMMSREYIDVNSL